MSAWLLPNRHIDTLVAWASRNGASYYHGEARRYVNEDECRIAAELYAENVRSLNCRYKENEPTEGYVFKWPSGYKPLPDPIVILKMCNCYDYQACETDSYPQSEAYAIVDGIRHEAIRKLPGYDGAAGWPLEDYE
jgi:hypothetical protein